MAHNVAEYLLKKYGKKNAPTLKAGDTVRVHQRIKEGEKERIQIFEGLVIATKHGAGIDGSFTVRKMAVGGVGVERTYPLHSPNILKVERTKTADVSRAKLYYMRDRLGKAARFKSESRNPMMWEEKGAEALIEAIEEQVAEAAEEAAEAKAEEAAAEGEVEVQPEGTTEAEAVEVLESTEEAATPSESEEVIAAVEGEALAEEEK
jgi:large subunit ribosomal protein L19